MRNRNCELILVSNSKERILLERSNCSSLLFPNSIMKTLYSEVSIIFCQLVVISDFRSLEWANETILWGSFPSNNTMRKPVCYAMILIIISTYVDWNIRKDLLHPFGISMLLEFEYRSQMYIYRHNSAYNKWWWYKEKLHKTRMCVPHIGLIVVPFWINAKLVYIIFGPFLPINQPDVPESHLDITLRTCIFIHDNT